jgi:hypothetical protein
MMAFVVDKVNRLDIIRLSTSTKRADTETMALDTLDIGNSQVGDTGADSSTVITNGEFRVS